MSSAPMAPTKLPSWGSLRTPEWQNKRTFSRKPGMVGMEVISKAPESSPLGFCAYLHESHVLILFRDFLKDRPNWRHAPHQAAQKSTRTLSLPSILVANCSPVMLVVTMMFLPLKMQAQAGRGEC